MMQTHSLEKLFHGKALYLNDKKEIVNLFRGPRKKSHLFTKKSKLEQEIFEKYIKNFNLKEFRTHFFESSLLLLKKGLNAEEREKIKKFQILIDLIQSIECENDLKNKLLHKINTIEIFKRFNDCEKKEFINQIINFSSEINVYNNSL